MPSPAITFEAIATCPATGARRGRVHTPHGSFETPAFMPVGTQGTIKGLLPETVAKTGSQCILANTYHLLLRPGGETVAALGDLHSLMAWPGPILTDSGGFQVFSLSQINKIDDHGVTFKSHLDGKRVHLTPEKSIEVQNQLGADIIMAFDQCPHGQAPLDEQRTAVERTLRWAIQSKAAHQRAERQGLFGIVQGGSDGELRRRCALELVELDLPGYAVGGLAVGEGYHQMLAAIEFTTPLLPATKPRYLMGVGYPRDMAAAVARGIDMFDCVLPTRNGRTACGFTAMGQVRIRNAIHINSTQPIEAGCDCYACLHFSRGAIRHFFMANEMLGPILLSLHNIRFYQRFMADMRQSLEVGGFEAFLRDDPRCRLGPPGQQTASNAAALAES